jgi:hypothetical protein
MRKALQYLFWGLGGVVTLLGIAVLYNSLAPLPTYPVHLPTW